MSGWQPIETSPKADADRLDLWAKCWRADFDDFIYSRFPDCYWTKGDSMTNRHARWVNLGDGWCPTHWMPIPPGPRAMSEPQYDCQDMDNFYLAQEKRELQKKLDMVLEAAKSVIERADSEGWLCYNGTDESRLDELEDAIAKAEGR